MSVNKFKVGDVVKCIASGVFNSLTTGKDYVLLDVRDDGDIKVENDEGGCFYHYSYRFELSNGGSANAQQTHKSPKFKEGDMVYLIGFGCLKPFKLLATSCEHLNGWLKVEKGDSFRMFTENGYSSVGDITPSLVLATEENRLMLNKLLGVEYEPLKLTGSDLAKKLLKDKPQTCYMSDISDDVALSNKCIDLIAKFENGGFIAMNGVRSKFAVPCNQHGEVLDDE